MTENDSQPDDGEDRPDRVGEFPTVVPDGGSSDPDEGRQRTDGSGETNRGFGKDASFDADEGRTVGRVDFAGFDFGTWLEETEARATTEATEAADDAEASVLEEAYSGFSFRQWMEDDDVEGPAEPPASPRVVTPSLVELESESPGVLASLLPGGAESTDTYPGGFEFTDWLDAGDTEYVDPEMLRSEPSGTPSAGAGVSREPSYPSPPGDGLSDLPPAKVAVFAVFAATLTAVALTLAGGVAPLGPATGFADPSGGETGGAPAATATPTPTATDTPEPTATPTPEPTDTPTPTDAPTPTPTETPTPTPTPTSTPEPTDTPTPAPEPTETDGGILDPVTG